MNKENKGRDYYREQQKKNRELQKDNMKWLWISKLPDRVVNGKVEKNPLNKGRTYVKDRKDGE